MAEGIVVSIHLASGATEPMRGVAEARAVPGRGLEGDRYFEGRGTFSGSPDTELTLVEAEAVEALVGSRANFCRAVLMRSSENPVSAEFGERPFHALGGLSSGYASVGPVDAAFGG